MNALIEASILKPLLERNVWLRRLTGVSMVITVVWAIACFRLVSEGHTLLGTTSYGVVWGITVANIIHIIGISHVGIAVSATVRILKLERYRNVARLAEMMTLVSLIVAVINIGLDVGRPERFLFATLLHGRWHAPMVWSATVISLYFLSSGVYLYLSMRRDLWILSRMEIRFQRLYAWLSRGYQDTEEERQRHDRVMFWLAIALMPIMISVHSVYGLFFGLLSAKAGWYNPLQPPYFVLGAVVSGFSALIVVMALLRRLFGWRDLLVDRTFRVFGAFLAFMIFLYLYFITSEHLTAQYAAPTAERAVSSMLLWGPYAGLFWTTVIGGLAAMLVLLFLQSVRSGPVNVRLITVSAAVVNVAMLVKRMLLVLPAQQHLPLPLPMPMAGYHPTVIEWVTTLGTYFAGGLLFAGLLRLFPMVELPLSSPVASVGSHDSNDSKRKLTVGLTLVAGVALITWGIAGRSGDFAPIRWIVGLCLFAVVPLEMCVIKGTRIPLLALDGSPALERGE